MIKLIMAFLLSTLPLTVNAESDIDWQIVQRVWLLIKEQTQAPYTVQMPPIEISDLMPAQARMMFQYPTKEDTDTVMMIKINPATLNNYNREMISWGIGHELTHYAMILEENNWELNRKSYTQTIRHHCNARFMQITRAIADLIYNVYHDERTRYQMYDQVQASCRQQPWQ